MGDGNQPMTTKDSLGRLVPDVAAIRQLLSDAKVGRETPLNESKSSKSSESLDEVVSILQKLDSKFKEDFERTQRYFDALVKTSKAELKESRNDDGCCEKLLDAIKSLGKVQEKAFDGFSADSQKMHRALSGLGGGNGNGGNGGNGGGSSGGGSGGGFGGGIGGGGLGDIAKTKKGWAQFFQWGESTGAKMLGGFDAIQHVMNGVVEKTIMFSNELKRTAWRVQGVTGDMTGLQKQWEASVSTWSELKELNGQSMQNNMAIYNKIRQKGILREIKDLKTINKLMQSAGLASTVLGSNAETTADLFGDWFVQLKLSENQLGAIGRHMGRIGRETGVTGDAMIDVAKSSENMLKNLKKYGNLTVSSTENVLNLMTRAKKTGHEQEMEEFLKPLQSRTDFLNAEGPMKNSHIRAAERVGRGQDLRNGTLLKSKEGMADLAKGRRMDIESILPMGTTLDNFDELNDDLRAHFDDLSIKANGLTLQQNKEMIEMQEESSESFSSKFDKLKSKKLAEHGDTESSKNLIKGYEKQLDDLTMSGRSSIMSGINEKAKKLSKIKGGGPVNADTIMSSMQKENGGKGNDTTKQIDEMIAKGEIKGGATNAEKLKSVFMAQAEQLKKKGGVGTDGIDLTTLASSMDVNSADALANVSEELQKAQDKIMAKEGNNTNPMDSLKDAIEKMNSWVATHLQPLLSAIPKEVLYLGAIASILPGILGVLGIIAGGFGVMKTGFGLIKNLFTRGGGGPPFGGSGRGSPTGGLGGPGGGFGGGPGGPGPVITPKTGRTIAKERTATLGRGASREARLAKINETRSRGVMTGRARMPRAPLTAPKPSFGSKVKGLGSNVKGKLGTALNFLGLGATAANVAGAASGGGGGGGGMGDCQPVWVCNMDSISGPLDQMGNSLADNALNGLVLADAASDLKDAGKTLTKTGTGKPGVLTKWFGKGTKVGKLFAPVTSKLAPLTSKLAPAMGFLGKFAKGVPFLGAAIGGLTGAMEEDDGNGRGTTEKAILGALTGSSHKGSMFSGMVGIEKGSAADEAMGVLGAAGSGALLGAAIAGPVGAAVGAALGSGAELYKIMNEKHLAVGIKNNAEGEARVDERVHAELQQKRDAIEDPVAKAQEQLRIKTNLENLVSGSKFNAERTAKERDEIGGGLIDNWFTSNTSTAIAAADAAQAALERAQKNLANIEKEIAGQSLETVKQAEEANKRLQTLMDSGLSHEEATAKVNEANKLVAAGMSSKDAANAEGAKWDFLLWAQAHSKAGTNAGTPPVKRAVPNAESFQATLPAPVESIVGPEAVAELNRQLAGVGPESVANQQLVAELTRKLTGVGPEGLAHKSSPSQFDALFRGPNSPHGRTQALKDKVIAAGMTPNTSATIQQGAIPGSIKSLPALPQAKLTDEESSEALGTKLSAIVNTIIATSKPISDVHDRVREQNASNTAEVPRSASLARIDEISEKQLAQLVNINAGIKELIEFEKTKAKEQEAELVGYTAAQRKEQMTEQHNANTPDYGGWPQALSPRGMGNNQVISDGVIT